MANNENEGKDTFILRTDFYPQVKLLTREQRGDLLLAIFAYASDEDIPQMDGMTSMCFQFIKASIDTYTSRYNARCQKNRENGKRGGRPKKSDNYETNQMESDASEQFDFNQSDNEKTDCFNGNQLDNEKAKWFNNNLPETNHNRRFNSNQLDSEKTNRFYKQPKESEKTGRAKKNRDYDYEYDSELFLVNNDNTHTVCSNRKGGLGENQPAPDSPAAKLLAWVEEKFPAVQRMTEPFTEQQAIWMLGKYTHEDIKRIVAAMDNKGATRNKSAYSTFVAFAARDVILQERKATAKPHTYNEVCDLVAGGRYTWDDFELTNIRGVKCWVKKIDVIQTQA